MDGRLRSRLFFRPRSTLRIPSPTSTIRFKRLANAVGIERRPALLPPRVSQLCPAAVKPLD
eukprot:3935103-Pyramimonas_sp.AAC.1